MSGPRVHGQADVLHGAPFDLVTGSAAPASAFGRLAGTIRDLVLIALAWMIFVGVLFHPGVQIIGIAACALALLVGSIKGALGRRAEI